MTVQCPDVYCRSVKRGQLNITQSFLDLESRAYWAAVVWDTSDALASDMRTLLTSGLKGACSEPAWRLSKAFLVGSFAPATEGWCLNEAEVTEERASRIIGAASVCQTLLWKNITSVKEALREGVDEETVLWVWGSLQETVGIFNKAIHPLPKPRKPLWLVPDDAPILHRHEGPCRRAAGRQTS